MTNGCTEIEGDATAPAVGHRLDRPVRRVAVTMQTNDAGACPVEREVRRLVAEGKTTAHMTGDERHDWVVREFPVGLNGVQFAALTVVSAGDDGIVDPPAVADWFKRQSLILGLWMREGLIERRCRRDEAGPYYLTTKARAYLKT